MLPTIRTRNWSPARWTQFPAFGYELDRFFDQFLRAPANGWSATMPAADLFETDEEFVLECELPGYRLADVEVTVEQGVLTLSGQRNAAEGDAAPTYHVRERGLGQFTRSFSLPHTIDANAVRATLENGVLRVALPKAEDAKARRIEVKVK